jgi:leader peptidase (prepilin peptidase)/N-methyltransferase
LQLSTFLPVLAGFVGGLLAGSFIATFVIRWPDGRSSLAGRSRCDSCGTPVPAGNLVPLVSFAMQRGEARCCGARIDPLHLFAEFAAAVIGGLSALLPWHQALAGAWFGWSLLALALIDLRVFRLPNGVVALLAASGVGAALVLRSPAPLVSLIGAAAGFTSLETVRLSYRAIRGRDGIGRGDPKLFGAIGAWLGWLQLPLVLLIASLAGLVWAASVRLAGRPIGWADRMPLGSLLALASWPVWFFSNASGLLG